MCGHYAISVKKEKPDGKMFYFADHVVTVTQQSSDCCSSICHSTEVVHGVEQMDMHLRRTSSSNM